MESRSGRYEAMGQYARSDIVLESNSLLRAVFFILKNLRKASNSYETGSNNNAVCICRCRRLYGLVSWRTGWFFCMHSLCLWSSIMPPDL